MRYTFNILIAKWIGNIKDRLSSCILLCSMWLLRSSYSPNWFCHISRLSFLILISIFFYFLIIIVDPHQVAYLTFIFCLCFSIKLVHLIYFFLTLCFVSMFLIWYFDGVGTTGLLVNDVLLPILIWYAYMFATFVTDNLTSHIVLHV